MENGPGLMHTSSNDVYPFNGASVFRIGRSGECDLDISAIYISRKQCRIEKLENVGWAIFDESRFKTTKLNNGAIRVPYVKLEDGDRISFTPNDPTHEYIFCDELPVCSKKRKCYSVLLEKCLIDMPTQNSCNLSRDLSDQIERCTRDSMVEERKVVPETNDMSLYLLESENKCLLARLKELEERNKELSVTVARYQCVSNKSDGCSEDATVARHQCVSDKSDGCSEDATVARHQCVSDKSDGCHPLLQQLQTLKQQVSQITEEKSNLQELITDAETEIESLLLERCCKIIKFGSVDAKDRDENGLDTLTALELSLMKADINELSKKNSELSTNLEIVNMEKDSYTMKFNEIIENELYCSICSDLMYQAITLQCKHTFCKMCIEEWKKKKKDCPVCRSKIRTQVPCLIIDNFIDKIAEMVGGEIKARRTQLIKERTAAEAVAPPKCHKRKRHVNIPTLEFPPLDPILEHLQIGYAPLQQMFDTVVGPPIFLPTHNFPEVVDLTNGTPPHPPFRGYERHARRRRR